PRGDGLADLDEAVGQVLEELAVVAQNAEHRLEPLPRLLAPGLLAGVVRVAEAVVRDAVAVLEVLAALPEQLAVAPVRLAVARRIELVVAAALPPLDPHHPGPPVRH